MPYCWIDRGCCSLWEQGLPAMKVTRSSGKPRRLHREQALLPQVPQAIGHRPAGINPLAAKVDQRLRKITLPIE
ncbi:hypothetical protein F7R20_27335 [Pseudomonas brassicacearum subsp. brassicacearum]|nr:hypothetical protein F7R20_27335 [Pseudomonas brassicacearum subsp. brassicacearum]